MNLDLSRFRMAGCLGFVKVWSRVRCKTLTDNKTCSVFETEGCGFDPARLRSTSYGSAQPADEISGSARSASCVFVMLT